MFRSGIDDLRRALNSLGVIFLVKLLFCILLVVIAISAGAQESPANVLSSSKPIAPQKLERAVIDIQSLKTSACNKNEESLAFEVKSFTLSRLLKSGEKIPELNSGSEYSLSFLNAVRRGLSLKPEDDVAGMYTLCQLREAAWEVTQEYPKKSGLLTAQVIIPAQEVVSGELEFQVLIGHLEKFCINTPGELGCSAESGVEQLSAQTVQIKKQAQNVLEALVGDKSGAPLMAADVERAVLLLGEVMDSRTTVTLLPGKENFGTNLAFHLVPKDVFSGGVSVDNLGAPYTGVHQSTANFLYRGALVDADHFSGTYTTSDKESALNSYSLSYDLPVGYGGSRFGLYSAYTHYALAGALAASQSVGNSRIAGVNLVNPVFRSSDLRADFSLGFNHMALSDSTATTAEPRTAQVIWTDFRGVRRDASGSTSWGMGVTGGYLSVDPSTASATLMSRRGAYNIFFLDAKRQQFIATSWDAIASIRGQVAGANLDNYHKFALAGINGVRAFPTGEASGDSGFIAKAELGYSWVLEQVSLRLATFYDYGSVTISHTPLSSGINDIRLAGYGLQTELSWERARATVFWATPHGRDRALSLVDNSKSRVGIMLNFSF